MKIILIRHASRVRAPTSDNDRNLPLSLDGLKQARELADKMASQGLRPTLYLTSHYAHAKQTGEILRDLAAADPPVSVVAIDALTPHEAYDFEGIIRASEETGHDLSKLEL